MLPDWLSLQESPLLPRSLGAAYFDGDGVATRDNCFVANGILQSYVLSEYSARKLGLQTTANAGGVHNLSMHGPSVNPAKLFKEMGTGLYICELMGQGVNGVTGIILAAPLGIGWRTVRSSTGRRVHHRGQSSRYAKRDRGYGR